MRTVTITGTRETGHKSLAEYADLFEQYLEPFVPAAHFYLGGAVGIDSLALLWLADRTTAAITVVAPGTLSQQPAEAREAVARTRGPHHRDRGARSGRAPVTGLPRTEPVDGRPHVDDHRVPSRLGAVDRHLADDPLHSRAEKAATDRAGVATHRRGLRHYGRMGNRAAGAATLKRLRHGRGLSLAGTARALSQTAMALHQPRLPAVASVQRSVARWESAAPTLPDERYQLLLAHLYARTPAGEMSVGPGSDLG
ncbi:hypothetical protein RB201_20125 [Streptomyces sp. S1A(2023)]